MLLIQQLMVIATTLLAQNAEKEEGLHPRFQLEALLTEEQLENEAAQEFERARDFIGSGAVLYGYEYFENTAKKFKASRAAASVQEELLRLRSSVKVSREIESRDLLDKAKKSAFQKDLVGAARYLMQVESRLQETTSYREALSLLTRLREDKALWRNIQQKLCENEIENYLSMAEVAQLAGRDDLAQEYVQKAEMLKNQATTLSKKIIETIFQNNRTLLAQSTLF